MYHSPMVSMLELSSDDFDITKCGVNDVGVITSPLKGAPLLVFQYAKNKREKPTFITEL